MVRVESYHFISLILLVLTYNAHSVRFDVQSGHTKCIAEDIKSNSMTVGKYSVVNPNEGHPLPDSHKISVSVRSEYGNSYHKADQVESGQFAFTAPENGDYLACFFAPRHEPEVPVIVDFEWKSGIEARIGLMSPRKDLSMPWSWSWSCRGRLTQFLLFTLNCSIIVTGKKRCWSLSNQPIPK